MERAHAHDRIGARGMRGARRMCSSPRTIPSNNERGRGMLVVHDTEWGDGVNGTWVPPRCKKGGGAT